MNDINILEAVNPSNIKEIEELAYRIWNEHYIPIIGKEQVDYMLSNFQTAQAIENQIKDGYRYYLVCHNDKGIGYFAIIPCREDQSLFLSKFYISKEFRGRGIARACLSYMENICREYGLNSIWLTVNKYNSTAIKAYQRLGFNKVGELIQDIGNGFIMDDYKMKKIV